MSIYHRKTHAFNPELMNQLNRSMLESLIIVFLLISLSLECLNRVGYSIKRKLSQVDFYTDKQSQIRAIENSFECAKQPITKHFSKQGVFPEQEMPIFPDFDVSRYSNALV